MNEKLIFHRCVLGVLGGQIQAAAVDAEGRAAGDLPNAREIALADALREAVRQGTGLNVLGSTGTSNFTLEFDRVLGSAFGHVKSYKVVDSRLGADGIYRVKLSAEVEKGAPNAKNSFAMRELLLRKNSPRLSVRIDGPAGRQASLLLEEAARDLQIQTVPPEAPCDFLILGDLSLRHTGRQTLHGNPPQNVFATRGALRAVRADTGDIVVSDSLASLREIGSPLLEIPDAENDALEYESVLLRPGLIPSFTKNEIHRILDAVCLMAQHQKVFFAWRPFLKDPNDDLVLELAVAASAPYIITHNISDFAGTDTVGVRAITPSAAIKILKP